MTTRDSQSASADSPSGVGARAPIEPLIEQLEQLQTYLERNKQAASRDHYCGWRTFGEDAVEQLVAVIELLRYRAGAQKDAPAWQSIETAPKDGTPILAARVDNEKTWRRWPYPEIAVWLDGPKVEQAGWHAYTGRLWLYQPTHWMPLPDPPGAQKDAPEPETEKK